MIDGSVRLLDWWDPYKDVPSPYDQKELAATMTLDPSAVQRFAEEFPSCSSQ